MEKRFDATETPPLQQPCGARCWREEVRFSDLLLVMICCVSIGRTGHDEWPTANISHSVFAPSRCGRDWQMCLLVGSLSKLREEKKARGCSGSGNGALMARLSHPPAGDEPEAPHEIEDREGC